MATPTIRGFVTRAECGLVPPRSISKGLSPEEGGLAVHWGGPGSAPSTHEGCLKRWRDWQNFHMTSQGWTDIAYNFGYCNHGYVLAGRGLYVRSGAQGTTFGNDHFYAACWVGGEQSTPSDLAKNALLWLIGSVRQADAGLRVKPHGWFKSTSCPGSILRAFIVPYDDKEIQLEIAGYEWTDADEWPSWAKDAIIKNIKKGFIRGIAEEGNKRRFEPNRPLTRAEAAVLLDRVGHV